MIEEIDELQNNFSRFMFLSKQKGLHYITYDHFFNKMPAIVREGRVDSKVKSGLAHLSCALYLVLLQSASTETDSGKNILI